MSVNGETLSKIEEILRSRIGEVHFSATCADRTERDFKSAHVLGKYENSKNSEIIAIRISSRSGDWSKHGRILVSGNEFRTLDIEITGTHSTAPRLRDDLVEIFEGSKSWYWFLYKIDFINLLFGSFFALWLLANIYIRLKRGTFFLETSSANSADWSGAMLLAIIFLVIGAIFHLARHKIFPRIQFLIGQGVGRHRLLENFQWVVVIGFLVSFVAGIATLIFT